MRLTNMVKIREILRLKSLGIGIRATAESCSCSRNTVREILRRSELQGLSWPISEDMDDAKLYQILYPLNSTPVSRKSEPDYQQIYEELKSPHVNLKLLWTEYKSIHPDGLGYSQFCFKYSKWAAKTKAVMHIKHKPGDEMFVDWAGTSMSITDRNTGKEMPAYLFVSTIGASAYPYVEAFPSENLENWILAHVHAFEYYHGIPRQLIPDNLKTGVNKACNYDPELNKTYLELSEYYGCAIVPARSRKPRDKASVEGTVGDISTWIIAALRHEKFFSLYSLNSAIHEKLLEFSDKPYEKKDGSRKSTFLEVDLPALKPLPSKPYEIAEWKTLTVSFSYHIEVDKMYYSVPYTYIQKSVDVRITSAMIEVYCNHVRICSHKRLYGKAGQYSTLPEHMPPNHRDYLAWDKDKFLSWASKIGQNTEELVKQIFLSKKIEQQAFRSCFGLLKLADKYTPLRLENACEKALFLKSPSYTTVGNILKNGMDKVAVPVESPSSNVIPLNSRVRGAAYYAGGSAK